MTEGKICVLDIDMQVGVLSCCHVIGYFFPLKGVRSLKKTDLNPVFVFVRPPSLEILVSLVVTVFKVAIVTKLFYLSV